MFSPVKPLFLFAVSVVALMLSSGTICWASLMAPALPEFIADEVDAGNEMSPESAHPTNDEDLPTDSPANPLRQAARKGFVPSGSSSSSSSPSLPTSGAGSSILCGIAVDPVTSAGSEQSERLYADTVLFIPSAVHSRLFRPPQVA